MADVDDATSALIARMLAEDQAAVYHGYGGDMYGLAAAEDSDDSDWGVGGARKKKKKGKGASRAAAKKEPKPPREPKQKRERAPRDREDPADQEYSATGRRKRKDTGKARTASRAWTDEEERLFLEALELHGRNWKACAEHVGTRDARSFTSHAQKHFIKLCLQGKRLPPKVAESGDGYTLSGKPLDPNSAAARAYGFKPDSMQKLLQEAGAEIPGLVTEQKEEDEANGDGTCAAAADPADDGGVPLFQAEGCGASAPDSNGSGPGAPDAEPGAEDAPKPAPAAVDSGPPGGRKRRAATGGKENIDILQAAAAAPAMPPAERTEYAKSRPQRRTAGMATYKQQTSESLELQHLLDFTGPVASGATGCQPFSVDISSAARLVMDFHAHLSTHEIIGLLGGLWDAEAKSITIREAFPCRRASGSDSQTSVELDPAHEVETRALMEERGLVPVGWYHSHPTFAPTPSSKDNSNQHNYQALFRDSASGMEPFVGVIVGPYDIVLPSSTSASTIFFVQEKSQGLLPFRVRHTVSPMELPDQVTAAKLRTVTEMFKDDIGRVDFTELWRPFTTLDARGTPAGGPVTKLAKLRNALAAHLPSDKFKEGEDLLDACAIDIQKMWGLDLGYKA